MVCGGKFFSEGKKRTRPQTGRGSVSERSRPLMGAGAGKRQRADTGGGGVGAMATTTKTGETMTDPAKARLFAFVRETTEKAKALGMGEKAKRPRR